MSKRWIAMLLAGGQGTRLGELTDGVAKPAVPFGGKYRIIDYTLSNCSHSRIDTVGVLTQYQPHLLNTYVGHGKAWGLDRNYGGVTILPPYQRNNGGDWYKGTANAVYQNIDYIDHYDPEYVLIISGDHIYQMDYRKLLQFHIEKGADASIAVIQVPLAEAGRFGIMKTDESNRIIEFAEKPSRPTSNLASMGVYLFTWKILKQHLIEDENNPFSTNDFGKDVIPNMLLNEDRLFAYRFNGYWKDVGTIQSLWDANMDLLKKELVVHDSNWEIYSGTTNFPPLYVSPLANIKQSILNEGSIVHGTIINSVLSYNVHVGQGSVIKDSVVMPNVMIGKNVMIEKAIIGSDAIVEDGMVIGSQISPEVTLFTKKERIAASNR